MHKEKQRENHRVLPLQLATGSNHFKFIANAPDGLDAPAFGNAFQLFPKPLHMDIHGAAVTEVVKAPYFVQQLIAGQIMQPMMMVSTMTMALGST